MDDKKKFQDFLNELVILVEKYMDKEEPEDGVVVYNISKASEIIVID